MYLLFDLDGTLTKPEMGITNSIKYALNKFGIVETDGAKLRLCIGPPLIDSFMDVWGFDQTKAELAVELYREYFTDRGLFENEVYDGIHTLLKELCEQGHHIFLATSKPEEYAGVFYGGGWKHAQRRTTKERGRSTVYFGLLSRNKS